MKIKKQEYQNKSGEGSKAWKSQKANAILLKSAQKQQQRELSEKGHSKQEKTHQKTTTKGK